MRSKLIAAFAASAAAFGVLAASAEAHVSLHPNELPAGANATLDIRVPNETDNANTTKLAVQVPPGFLDISTEPIPGWTAKVLTRKLAKPVKTEDGTTSEEVREIIWTGNGQEGKIPPGGFQNFPILTEIPDDQPGKVLTFKTVQYYDKAPTVRWIGPPDSEHPAPTIDVTAAKGTLQDVAGTEAGPPPPGQGTTAQSSSSGGDKASKGLGIAALILGALGLVAGGAALVRSRRPA